MIEAINWYLHKRTATHADLDDLKAYVLLTAVKNQRKDVVVRLLQQTTMKRDRLDRNRKGGAPSVALSLASLCLKSPPENQGEGTEPDDNRENGLSLWVWAIQCGHLSLVEVLMDEVSITDSMHRIEDKRFTDGRTDMPHMYMPSTYMPTPIRLASRNGHEAIVRALLAKKPDLHNCALEEAVAEGHEEMVRMLLGHGTAFGFKNDSKMSSSILKAAHWGHENIIRVLLDHGADIESRDFGGNTPLAKAASRGHEAAVRLLLKKGANPLATDKDGRDTRYMVLCGWKFELATGKSIYASKDLVDDVYKRACELMHPSRPCPPLTRTRRARLSLYVDTAWVRFVLLSLHVCLLEIPPASPIEVSSRYNRELNFFKSSSTITPITLEFSIIHQEDTLDFAIEYAKSLTGVARLEVVGGGTRSISRSSYDTIFQTWTGVELDPNAEFVDS